MQNLILMTDSYKATHWRQYPPGTQTVYSYFESRGVDEMNDCTLFFGLQPTLHRLARGISTRDIDEAEAIFGPHIGQFNRAGWELMIAQYRGALPIRIRAVPEGTVVPSGNVLMTVENTDPEFYWLTNYLETLLVQTWYPTTVATISREMRGMLGASLSRTGPRDGLDLMLHDFGVRGSTSMESAGLGGAGHLVNFRGTDNVPALKTLIDHYAAPPTAGLSIPAAEHSTITSWGRDHEIEAYRNMMDQYPCGPVAVVSDSYDLMDAVDRIWGQGLRDRVVERDGLVVIRPDSGDPSETLPLVLESLGRSFGYTRTASGHRLLDPHVRVIQGDGIDRRSLPRILLTLEQRGWSLQNLVFGSGGGLLQDCGRDTGKFAFKCSQVVIDGEPRDVNKSPVDAPWKASKLGRLALIGDPERGYRTVPGPHPEDLLETVFQDGRVLRRERFDVIRERAG